jgi:hypothetical protein
MACPAEHTMEVVYSSRPIKQTSDQIVCTVDGGAAVVMNNGTWDNNPKIVSLYLLNLVLSELCDCLKKQLLDPLMHCRFDGLMNRGVTWLTDLDHVLPTYLKPIVPAAFKLKPGLSQSFIAKIACIRDFTV